MSVSSIQAVGVQGPGASNMSPQQMKLRQSIQRVVGQMLYSPMMKMARDNPFKGKLGHGGRGEEIFRARLDAELMRRASSRIGGPLTEALYDRLAPNVR